jgi:hypothetical protein
MAGEIRVRVEETQEGLAFHLHGPAAKGLDRQLIQDCASAVFACARENDCFDRGLTITQACVRTVGGHDQEADCVKRGFGLSTV